MRSLPWLLLLGMVLALNACATIQPTDAGGPRATGPPYPVVFVSPPENREIANLELSRVVGRNEPSGQPRVEFDPVTATIKSLSSDVAAAFYLPRVGTAAEMSEPEARESLRRLIQDWRALIGAEPSQLALVEQIDRPDGTKTAVYEQRVFRYPLRGDYGKLQIHFSNTRRLLNISSTCIPNADRLQTALAPFTPRVKVEDVLDHVRSKPLTFGDNASQPRTLSANSELAIGDLVTYALPSTEKTGSLELRIAWEVNVTNAPFKVLYLDAILDEVIGAR